MKSAGCVVVMIAASLGAAGCRQLFGLDSPQLIDGGNDVLSLDAPPVDAARVDVMNDLDGDGKSDPDDNCPMKANADQGNEDGDALGDVCDPCPVSPLNTDTDNDGVGDVCDPRPNAAGDMLVLFEGFHHGVPTTWTKDGTWSAAGDSITTSTGSGGTSNIYLPAYSSRETVSAGGAMTSTFGTDFRTFGVQDNAALAIGYATVCSLLITASTDSNPNTPMVDLFRLPTGNALRRNPVAWGVGNPLVVALLRQDNNYTCLGEDTAAGVTGTAANNDGNSTSTPKIGFHVFSAAARYDWLMVVTSP